MDLGWQKYIESVDARLEKLEIKLDKVLEHQNISKGKVIAYASVISFFVTAIISILFKR